jgi:hypothetical protein
MAGLRVRMEEALLAGTNLDRMERGTIFMCM